MNSIIQTVNRYKAKSADPIRDQQVAYIPRIQDDQIDYIVSHYVIGGKRIPVNITNQLFIKLKYLKFRSIGIQKFLKYRSGEFSMQKLVDDKIIVPFMLFMNGYFIPWEYTTIAIDNDNYHIIVDGSSNSRVALMCRNCDFVQIVTLPEYTTCVTDYENPLNAMFVFDEYGKYDIDNPKYYIVSSTGYYSIGFNYWHTEQSVNAFKLLNQTDIKLTDANIMLFVNGLLSSGVRNKTPRGIDTEYEREDGHEVPHVDLTYSPNHVSPNPEVRLDSVLLTISGGYNQNNDIYDFGLFVNPNYTETTDNISKIDIDQLAPIISNHNLTGTAPDYLANLRVPFEMRMDRKKYYAENLVDSLKTMSQYDASLFNSIFSDTSNLIIEEHNYEWIQAHLKGGAIIFPISYGDNTSEYIVVLVNGRLYDYSHMIRYYTSKVIIPIQSIGPEDTVEFLRFKNINNMTKKVIINENDGFINYSEEYINNSMCLFSKKFNGNSDTLNIFYNGTNIDLIGEWVTIAYSEHREWQFLQNNSFIEIMASSENKATYIELATKHFVDVSGYNSLYIVTDTDLEYANATFTINNITADISSKGTHKIDISTLDGKYIPSIVLSTIKNNENSYSNTNLRISSMYLSDTEHFSYNFPDNGDQHFEIGYTLEKNDKGLTKVVLDDPYYYGKELTMTYRNRFIWEVFTIEGLEDKNEYVIDLGNKFKYCNQYNRYLVFLNNTRLSSDHYRLVLPVRPTTPFSKFKIYLTIPVTEGDKLDIIYTPALFQDIAVRDTINTSGDIILDKSILDYGLSTDLYMIWINGKKIAQSNISDIDTTHIRVTSDEQSTHALCITKFIPSIEEIDKAFDENIALWDTITSTMTADEINKLLGIKTNTITDTESNRYSGAADIRSVMNELIRDEFIANPSIDISGPFVYDYIDVDTTIVTGYDNDNNVLLNTNDANHKHNLIIDRNADS